MDPGWEQYRISAWESLNCDYQPSKDAAMAKASEARGVCVREAVQKRGRYRREVCTDVRGEWTEARTDTKKRVSARNILKVYRDRNTVLQFDQDHVSKIPCIKDPIY